MNLMKKKKNRAILRIVKDCRGGHGGAKPRAADSSCVLRILSVRAGTRAVKGANVRVWSNVFLEFSSENPRCVQASSSDSGRGDAGRAGDRIPAPRDPRNAMTRRRSIMRTR